MGIGRAVVGVIAGAGLVGAGYTGLGGQDNTTRDEAGQIVEGGEIGAFRIRLGDCFNSALDGDFESVDGVPCTGPHDEEVYFAFNLPDGPWPGEQAVIDQASEGCLAQFESFVGMAYEDSIYGAGPIRPTEGSWEELDDREVLCVISNYDGTKKTGTAKDTGV